VRNHPKRPGKKQVRTSKPRWRTIKNGHLAGKKHPVTKVPFNKNGFPKFKSAFNTNIPPRLYKDTDYQQFKHATNNLHKAIEKDPKLADKMKLNQTQREQIANGDTPDGYTWHHHQTTGKMQLVKQSEHADTGHTGGREIWGGGSTKR
jgi:hypothetical protein